MPLAEDNDMVKKIPSDRTDEPLHVRSAMAIVVRSAGPDTSWNRNGPSLPDAFACPTGAGPVRT
jgi:hypothetical protein